MRLAGMTFLLLVSVGQSAFSSQTLPAGDTEQVEKIHQELDEISKAYVSRDASAFERVFLPNYAGIRERPVFNLREQLIAMMRADSVLLRAGRKLDFETVVYENETPRIDVYGPVAVVSVTKRNHWRYRGQNCLMKAQSTELWIRRSDGWKNAAGHSTTIPCEPRPYHPIHPAVADIPSITRAPQNSDLEAERQVRELIDSFVNARTASNATLGKLIESRVADNFISTNPDGQTGRDLSVLRNLQAYSPSRPLGLRNQDDAIVIYDNAAIYTFRKKPVASGEPPQQVTIMFARTDGRWMIVASHATKY